MITDAIADGRILNIKKANNPLSEGGQFANRLTIDDFKKNIQRFWDNVNWKNAIDREMKRLSSTGEAQNYAFVAFVDTNDPNTGESRSNRIMLVTETRDSSGKNVVVIDEVSTSGQVEQKWISVNKTIKAYGKGSIRNVINAAVKEDRILYFKNKNQWAGIEGGQFANSQSPISFKDNIQHFWDNVNWRHMTDAEMKRLSSTGEA